jgi:hypothetical protein
MSLFIIIATRRADNVASAIKSSGLSNYELKDDAWLVSSKKLQKILLRRSVFEAEKVVPVLFVW